MKTVTFTYLGAECEYNFETKNLHIISKHSFNSPNKITNHILSKKHNIKSIDIKSITFKYNNTKLPSHLSNYFSNYPNLEYIELEKLDFKNVETINRFIGNCPKLKEISITHKNAENLTYIENLIGQTTHTKSITIKHINAPNLKNINCLLWIVEGNIENITIEDITAPNINSVNYLICSSTIKTLDLTKLGNTRVHAIHTLIINCNQLETLKLNPLTNTKEIERFSEKTPLLKTNIMSKINQVEKLDTCFLKTTPKNETLTLDKFKDISQLSSHLKESISDNKLASLFEENVSDEYIYPSIKVGKHKIKMIDYITILKNNIPILDKTEEQAVKEIITQSKYETKETIENFLTLVENKTIFKNKKCRTELISKLTIIKNLK